MELTHRPVMVNDNEKKTHSENLYDDVFEYASWETAKFINENMSTVPSFGNRYELLYHCLCEEIDICDGLFMEFGVYRGESINFMSTLMPYKHFYGFDSFEGLPDKWYINTKVGAYSNGGSLPNVRRNVELIKGWFEDTLPTFMSDNKKDISFVHIDCDLYSSAKTVLYGLKQGIKAGTVIVFDEYFNRPGWKEYEYKAFQEFILEGSLKYKYLGFVGKEARGAQVAVKII